MMLRLKLSFYFSRFRICIVSSLLLLVSVVSAELLVKEEFDYGGQTVAPMNGGEGWSGAWKDSTGLEEIALDLKDGELDPLSKSPEGYHVSPDKNGNFRKLSEDVAAQITEQSQANGEIWLPFTGKQTVGSWGSVTLWNAGCLRRSFNVSASTDTLVVN